MNTTPIKPTLQAMEVRETNLLSTQPQKISENDRVQI